MQTLHSNHIENISAGYINAQEYACIQGLWRQHAAYVAAGNIDCARGLRDEIYAYHDAAMHGNPGNMVFACIN